MFLTTLGLGWLSWLGLLALIEIGAFRSLTFCVCTSLIIYVDWSLVGFLIGNVLMLELLTFNMYLSM